MSESRPFGPGAGRNLTCHASESVRRSTHSPFGSPSVARNPNLCDLIDQEIITRRAEHGGQFFILAEVCKNLGAGYARTRKIRTARRGRQRVSHGFGNLNGGNTCLTQELARSEECCGGGCDRAREKAPS